MAIRSDPKKQRWPSLSGQLIIDSVRGRLRVRSWPRKRGTPKSDTVRALNTWFTSANRMAKKAVPSQHNLSIEQAKGTGFYPRDLLVKSIYGGMFDLVQEDGTIIQQRVFQVEDVMFQGFTLRLTANQNIGAGGENRITWPLPLIDTAGFWDVLTPTEITIPQGVEIMQFFAGMQSAGSVSGQQMVNVRGPGVARLARQETGLNAEKGTMVATPPINVSIGQIYFPLFFMATNGVVSGNGATFFSGQVLQAQ